MNFAAKTSLAALAAAGLLSACTAAPNTGTMAVSDGLRFDYRLSAGGAAHSYRIAMTLADAKSGAPVRDANVAVVVSGPGYSGDDLVNLRRAEGGGYGGEVVLPKPAQYRLTFQVNRATAPSAQAVFTAWPPLDGD
ncbi:MAG: hypothetical protein JSS35_17725 [Proteobacteria bacterium]|nr:hypothetical protein [Pseudomonadota bacterium]